MTWSSLVANDLTDLKAKLTSLQQSGKDFEERAQKGVTDVKTELQKNVKESEERMQKGVTDVKTELQKSEERMQRSVKDSEERMQKSMGDSEGRLLTAIRAAGATKNESRRGE